MSFFKRAAAAVSSTFKGREKDDYGDLHFISLLGATLSRLAYFNDNLFLQNYMAIMGPVILPEFLTAIDKVPSTDLDALLNDQALFFTSPPVAVIPSYQYKGKNFIDFLKMNIPQNINIINKETSGTPRYIIHGQQPNTEDVKYISLGWSNYGEVYIVADKRMSKTLFILFRGTYSAKTASLYSKPTSAIPLTTCGNETFLYGIFKTSSELIHTIIESARYLAVNFLGATGSNSVKIFTTGHSLGGAMSTIFSYLWLDIKKTAPYNTGEYAVLADNIVCVSLGAPRCMGTNVAQKFCDATKGANKKILFLRITTRGDPVPGLPQKALVSKTGFEHPCSTTEDDRKRISEDCNVQLVMGRGLVDSSKGAIDVNYEGALDCQNYKTRTYLPNPLSHTIYLDILFLNAVDIMNFLAGAIPNPLAETKEVTRTPTGCTVCRVIIGSIGNFRVGFFNVEQARANPRATCSSILPSMKIGGNVEEDVKMTKDAFTQLELQMRPLQGELCPKSGLLIIDIFTSAMMPDISKINCQPSTKNSGIELSEMNPVIVKQPTTYTPNTIPIRPRSDYPTRGTSGLGRRFRGGKKTKQTNKRKKQLKRKKTQTKKKTQIRRKRQTNRK